MAAPINPTRDYEDIRESMLAYLPKYYDGSRIVGNILDVEGAEMAALNAETADVLEQFYVDTATWGLTNWERICGIATDELKPVDQRRSVIKSKLRGVGTVNAAMIKNVAEAYDNGTVEVVENNAMYTVSITFVSNYGVPANLSDIQAALREILPAHLAINFVFTYMTWAALNTHAFTWGSLTTNNYTWSQYESLT